MSGCQVGAAPAAATVIRRIKKAPPPLCERGRILQGLLVLMALLLAPGRDMLRQRVWTTRAVSGRTMSFLKNDRRCPAVDLSSFS